MSPLVYSMRLGRSSSCSSAVAGTNPVEPLGPSLDGVLAYSGDLPVSFPSLLSSVSSLAFGSTWWVCAPFNSLIAVQFTTHLSLHDSITKAFLWRRSRSSMFTFPKAALPSSSLGTWSGRLVSVFSRSAVVVFAYVVDTLRVGTYINGRAICSLSSIGS